MKKLFITLKVQDGEHEHTHRVLTTCKTEENVLQAADKYAKDYYGKGNKEGDWYYFQGGTIAVKVQNVELLSDYEFTLLSKIFSGQARPGYFQIVQTGYEVDLHREEVEINCGENGKIMIHQDEDKLGFIIDVFGQTNEAGTMTIWEEDLIDEDDEEVEKDDDGNCKYCGQKCWEGQMCDEQQAGGFNNDPRNFSDLEIESFKAYWGQTHTEITASLGYSRKHSESDELLMEDYFWIEDRKEWYPKSSSMYTPRDQAIADYLRNN
jgi:hypothetical protein